MGIVRTREGFTIVELLIVVVVIAILAAITIVAYNGIQNSAHDSAIKSDLRNLAMKLTEFHARNGAYPKGGSTTAGFTDDFGSVPVTNNSYLKDNYNLYYCVGEVSGVEQFALAAWSKSGNKWIYSSISGPSAHTAPWGTSGGVCDGTDVPRSSNNFSYKYGMSNNNTWNAWIK